MLIYEGADKYEIKLKNMNLKEVEKSTLLDLLERLKESNDFTAFFESDSIYAEFDGLYERIEYLEEKIKRDEDNEYEKYVELFEGAIAWKK